MTLRPQILSAAVIAQTAAIHALILLPVAVTIGAPVIAAYGVFILIRLLNRRDDPRHAKRPPDAP